VSTTLLTRPAGTPGPTGRRTAVTVGALVAVAVFAAAASVLLGSRAISPVAALDPASTDHAIVVTRLTRTLLALAVGGALGLAGALMQGQTRNPLADPGILGVNAGASFAMVVAISSLGATEMSSYLWFAFGGAALAMVAVHLVATLGPGGATPVSLTIAGAAITAGLTSWTSGVLLTDRQTMDVFRFWQVGSVAGRDLDVLLAGLPFLLCGTVLGLLAARPLDALALGHDTARGLGRRTRPDRAVVGLAVVLLAGTATALAGPIAFVGLVVPHAVRAVVGGGHARLLPLSVGFGAVLTTIADTLGRMVLPPTEVQVGIMTAVVGVPAFGWFLRRGRMSGL
jgi:iron complex transport system permease protein